MCTTRHSAVTSTWLPYIGDSRKLSQSYVRNPSMFRYTMSNATTTGIPPGHKTMQWWKRTLITCSIITGWYHLWLITSAKEVCNAQHLYVSLNVCLLATLHKNYWSDLPENITRDVSMDKEELIKLNFGSHPRLNLDPGIFWRIAQQCDVGNFCTFWLLFSEKWSDLQEDFSFGQGSHH